MEGGNYIVSWCVGHLVELADASSYDERYAKWRYDDLPIVPEKMCIRDSNIHSALFSVAAYTVILCFSLFKTGSLAKSIFHAH